MPTPHEIGRTFEGMKVAEEAIVRALLPYKDRLPAAEVAMALVRCARVLLRKCADDEAKALTPALVAYLEGKNALPDGSSPIIQLFQ